MIFQKVLKGITGLSQLQAEKIVLEDGILCNWWRSKGNITSFEIKKQLTEANLLHHLNDYNVPLPPGHEWNAYGTTYGDVSPFISTTAGAIQRDEYKRQNIFCSPLITAIDFATSGFATEGYLFYAYVMTIGRKSIPLDEFAEEVRELHIYSDWLPYYREGEITAKLCIPSVNIEKAEFYDGIEALRDFKNGVSPNPIRTISNKSYVAPENFANIREILL
jgi:hypothetical protein